MAKRNYKKFKENFEKDGLGNKVEKVTKKTGIKKAVKFVFGEDCGCNKRKEKLNNLTRKSTRCFTEEQFNQWSEFRKRQNKSQVTAQEQREIIIPIYRHLFAVDHKKTNCAKCVIKLIDEINKVYDTYKE